jgi:hypothetical protein
MAAAKSGDHLEETVAATCRLIGGWPELQQVVVLANRRVTSDEYQRLQRHAAASQVELWTTASGVIRLRPRAVNESRHGRGDPRPKSGVIGYAGSPPGA